MHIIAMLEILAQVFFIQHAITTRKPRYWIAILLIPWVGFLAYVFNFFIFGAQATNSAVDGLAQSDGPLSQKGHRLLYISQGKLFQQNGGSTADPIQSPYGQKIIEQALRAHQKNEWKTENSGSHFGGSMLWGVDTTQADAIKVNITGATGCTADETLYYFLETDVAGGLFAVDTPSGTERRLFHKERFRAKDLDINTETRELVCAQQFPNSTSSIVLISPDGTDMRPLTEGDAVAESPSWIPGDGRRILFQSSGVARNKDGYAVGRGPASIQALDLDHQRMTTVLEDDRFDFLQPHISVDGYLYYIRRPYEMHPYRPATALLDFVLFPFRLLRAVFHYLNFFSLVYSKKPLTTASGPRVAQDDMKTILLKGKIIDADKALRQGARIMGVPSLVPASWELVRRDENDNQTVLARHTAAFDIGHDGTIVYSNGYGIFELEPHKRRGLLLRDKLIEDVKIG